MLFYIFPFEKIPKNSRVVLYAAGLSGKLYYNQIQETNYCKVVLWLDKNADGVNIKKPDAIKELSVNDYDFVVIAMSNWAIAEEIKEFLLECSVPENKIIHEIHSFRVSSNQKMSFLTTQGFLFEHGLAEKELVNYFYESEGDINYFAPFIDEIKQLLSSADKVVRLRTRDLIENKSLGILNGTILTPEAKIVLIYVLLLAGAFSKELMREFVNQTTKIHDNLSLKYWLITDLTHIWFLYPDILYEDFFTDMKSLRCDYAKKLCLNWNPPVYNNVNNANICVLVNEAAGATLQYITQVLCCMSEKGYKVQIIELSPFRNDSGMGILRFTDPFFRANEQAKTTREALLPYIPEDMQLFRITGALAKDRQQGILDLICEINPLCILDFSDEYAAISYYFSQSYPTIFFPMRKQGFSGSTFFHKYVIQGRETIEVHPPITYEQVLHLPAFLKRKEPLRVFSREEYGLTEEDIVVITVGNRLAYEISNELAEQMCELICNTKYIKWLIVGCTELSLIKTRYKNLIGENIVFISYETDLPGLYGICDIYLNPKRTGGGYSIGWAMQQGLALVSPVCGGDIETRCIGINNFLPMEADLVPYVRRLATDSQLLRQQQELSLKITAEWDWDNVINSFINKLIDGMNDLVNEFAGECINKQ